MTQQLPAERTCDTHRRYTSARCEMKPHHDDAVHTGRDKLGRWHCWIRKATT